MSGYKSVSSETFSTAIGTLSKGLQCILTQLQDNQASSGFIAYDLANPGERIFVNTIYDSATDTWSFEDLDGNSISEGVDFSIDKQVAGTTVHAELNFDAGGHTQSINTNDVQTTNTDASFTIPEGTISYAVNIQGTVVINGSELYTDYSFAAQPGEYLHRHVDISYNAPDSAIVKIIYELP